MAAKKSESARPVLQVIRTKAETAIAAEISGSESRLPGNAGVRALRQKAAKSFVAAGLPHRRIEAWKYTDIRQLQAEHYPFGSGGIAGSQAIAEVLGETLPGFDADTFLFVDGALVTSTMPKGIEALPLDKALADPPDWVEAQLVGAAKSGDATLVLNTAAMSGGICLRIADGTELEKPVHLIFHATHPEPRSVATRVIVAVGKGAKVTLVESHDLRRRQVNAVCQIAIADGGAVTHVTNLKLDAASIHLAHHLVTLGANATYKPFQLSTGEGLLRTDIAIDFDGQHSSFDLAGAALVSGNGHADTTLVVDHKVPHCTSRELFKCVLDGEAKGVFQGKVIVRPHAQKTDGKQMAKALLLSETAEFDAKPELEIYADDVICGHGATSMQLDDDQLFYFLSRGIPKAEARAMLTEAFVTEAIDTVEHEALRDALKVRARGWLMSDRT